MSKAIDLTGQRFGRLTAVERVGTAKNRQSLWKCKCDCGNETVVHYGNLKSGHTISCGCLKKEITLGKIKKQNQILCKDRTMLCMLTQKTSKNNTSGIKGVYWKKKSQKWGVKIGFKNRQKHIGLFSTLEAATKARALAEEEYFQPILDKYSTDIKPDLMEAKE